MIHLAFAGSGMGGHYLVGPQPGTDFTTLADALNQVEIHGIGDHVQLEMTPGTHFAHVEINPITRTGNPNARLIITSEDENDIATLTHTPSSATDNWIIKINQAEMIDIVSLGFKVEGSLNFTTAVMFDSGGNDITMVNNIFTSHPVNSTTTIPQEDASLISQVNDTHIDGLYIIDNEFDSGGAVLYLESADIDGLQNIVIEDNLMENQTIRFGPKLIYMIRSRDVSIQRNEISNQSPSGQGITLASTNNLIFRQNSIFFSADGYSLALRVQSQNTSDTTTNTLISNNFIQATQYGLDLSGLNKNVSVLNNTVLLSGTLLGNSAISACLKSNNSEVSEVAMRGNILINLTNGDNTRVLSVSNSNMFAESDYNIMFDSDGDSFFLDSTLYNTLGDYQSATGLDSSSLFQNVDFVDPVVGDLHLTSTMLEDPSLLIPANPDVIRDFDGFTRATNIHRAGADDAILPDLIFASGFED
ncbi:MAG: right-handed parallel beta-helix repeat-containing protein [Gammaproteobacteria bacterium]|jgi:hypothetical protein|nr:right-handed parallel beta-helix repeat-containing protein [Xanthomonadales bacterium]